MNNALRTKIAPVTAMLAIMCAVHPRPGYAQAPGGPPQATPVIAALAEEKTFSDKVEALGTLRANESVDLTSTVTEFVTEINFEDNQSVKKGDILVKMDDAEERAELEEQKSFLAEARRQVNRLEPLVNQGAASESILDERRRETLTAQARINAIQSRIDKRVIKAPYDGVLGLRDISVGALAQPGTLITTIDDISIMKLDFSVPEVFLSTLKPGVEITATSEAYPARVFKGAISGVDSRIDPATRAIQARAMIENPDRNLKPGLLMRVELQKSPRKTIVIPEEALITEGEKHFVLAVIEQDGKTIAERREVQVGARQFGEAEILDGVEKDMKIVTHGTLRARPGAEITVTAIEKNDETLRELLELNSGETPDEEEGSTAESGDTP
jgi:membrane fusion protein (multidrug efflux system)